MLLYDFILCVAAFQPALVIRNFLLYCAHGVILYHTLFKLEMQRLTDTRRLNSFHNFAIPYQNKCGAYTQTGFTHIRHTFSIILLF